MHADMYMHREGLGPEPKRFVFHVRIASRL